MEWSTRLVRRFASILAAIFLGCALSVTFAGADAAEGEGAGRRTLTNRDLPSLRGMDASRARLPEAVPVGSSGPQPVPVSPEPEAPAPAVEEPVSPLDEMTVPELRSELDHLRRRVMGIQVPFLSRRFVSARPDERKAHAGLSSVERLARVRESMREIRGEIDERGAEVPAWEFGQQAPLIEKDLREPSPEQLEVADGPEFPTVLVSETDDPSASRVFYSVGELSAPEGATSGLGDGSPEPIFVGDFDELPMVRPW